MRSLLPSLAALLLLALVTVPPSVTAFAPPRHFQTVPTRVTELFLFRRLWRKLKRGKQEESLLADIVQLESPPQPNKQKPQSQPQQKPQKPTEQVDICIIGGGVAGLTAALQSCQQQQANQTPKVLLLEAGPQVGGRVASHLTNDGFCLDVGFAVFIEAYPKARQILDYNDLDLKPFLPGALIKLPNRFRLARLADPLRQPADLWTALTAPVGGLWDKIKFVPLIWHIKTSSIEQLFQEPETSTAQALNERWKFSESMQQAFFKPFLEGIYLAPLQEQSSRMFLFVMKMLSEGAATLPAGGMGAVARQLADKAVAAGAEIRTHQTVESLREYQSNDSIAYLIETSSNTCIAAQSVIVATDGQVAQQLIAQLHGFASLQELPQQPQRSVGCLYYSFEGPPPVSDPILILNGAGDSQRNNKDYPINNICFPTTVQPSYAPPGYSLCSVTVLSEALEAFGQDDRALDQAVRQQLADWFRENSVVTPKAILNEWKLQAVYRVPKAQPAQLHGPMPANQNGGRPVDMFRGKLLPPKVFVCGDHMATATLNGALESGMQAGQAAAEAVASSATIKPKATASTS